MKNLFGSYKTYKIQASWLVYSFIDYVWGVYYNCVPHLHIILINFIHVLSNFLKIEYKIIFFVSENLVRCTWVVVGLGFWFYLLDIWR